MPPVDIEIPDDARELDRDVQAYYRELRAQRRRMLARRLSAPLSRDGMVLPLLAGCLALTLLAGTLLTVLTTGQDNFTPTRPAATARPRPASGTSLTYLPDVIVEVNGQQTMLSALAGSALVLALIPAACHCRADLQRVTSLAQRARASTFLVGGGTQQVAIINLAKHVGLTASHTVTDTYDQLPAAYYPDKLTAVLVSAKGVIAGFVANPAHNRSFRVKLQALSRGADTAPPSANALPQPAGAARLAPASG